MEGEEDSSFWLLLPCEIWLMIWSYIEPKDATNAEQVCKLWNSILIDTSINSALWRDYCRRFLGGSPQQYNRHFGQDWPPDWKLGPCEWKECFKRFMTHLARFDEDEAPHCKGLPRPLKYQRDEAIRLGLDVLAEKFLAQKPINDAPSARKQLICNAVQSGSTNNKGINVCHIANLSLKTKKNRKCKGC